MRRAGILLLLLAVIAVPGTASPGVVKPAASSEVSPGDAEPLSSVEPPEEALLIFLLRLAKYDHVLTDGLVSYRYDTGLYLPLGEVARALDFAIILDLDLGRAEGWFIEETRRFSLDLLSGEATVAGQTMPFDPGLVELHLDDIYVHAGLLERWFPINFAFDVPNLVLDVISREPLPIEQRLERERLRALLGLGAEPTRGFSEVDVPYRLWGWPFIDTTIETTFGRDEDGGDEAQSRYTMLATGDLLGMNARLFAAGSNREPLANLRLEAGRKDPEGGLLGPVAAREFTLGDVSTPRHSLILRSRTGRGVEISSFLLTRPDEFSRTTLRGTLPLGWEVELFRNDVLFDFQVARDDGRYEFIDVPLLFGLNEFRFVFFGPQGQRREEIERVLVGPGLIQPGEDYFRVVANQQDTNLIETGEGVDIELAGSGRFFAEYERGISDALSVAASLGSLRLEDGRHNYASLGLRGTAAGMFGSFDLVGDSAGGRAAEASVQTRFGPLNAVARHAQFVDFVSEQAEPEGDDNLRSRSQLRLDVLLPGRRAFRPFGSLEATHERRESGLTETDIRNRLSASIRRIVLSNILDLSLRRGGVADATNLSGNLLVNGRLPSLSLRGDLGYSVMPNGQLSTVVLSSEWLAREDLTARFGVSRSFDPQETGFTAGLSWQFKTVALGFNLDFSDDGSFTVRFGLTSSVGRDPRSGRVRMSSEPMAEKGAVSARLFHDQNVNGRFDEDDQPIDGAEFVSGRQFLDVATGEDGTAFVTNLPMYTDLDLRVSRESLEDPFWLPQPEGRRLVLRPGVVPVLDFPVVTTGEIDGTVYFRRRGVVREVANVRLELVDSEGEVVQEVRSAFDGFYLFELVPPGRYSLRVSPAQVAQLKLAPLRDREVIITAEGTIINGLDLTLGRDVSEWTETQ